jgi:glycine dehydrogenase subunit 1
MAFIPHTDEERRAMFEAIGVEGFEDFYQIIPENVRFPDFDLPGAVTEMEIAAELQALAEVNLNMHHVACFLGAGAYNHFIPAAVDEILHRNEFYTAYTPYQPEISQGTLQAIFEYQSLMVNLTGMDVSNASHYDGATAFAEGVIMALNVQHGKRKKVVLSAAIHPQYRQVVRTYTRGVGLSLVDDGAIDNDAQTLIETLDESTALVAVQYPDFFGRIQDWTALGKAAHEVGALFCVVVNPLALGLLKPPGAFGADIVVGDGQPLGIPLSFGGPSLGIFTTLEKYVRKMAGRLVGETVDSRGQRGYVLTLAPREQHIRREKATSNICTNQGLMALAATVYLSLMGKQGLRSVAELCFHKAHAAAKRIAALDGYRLWNTGDFFHEFVIECPRDVKTINERLLEWDIIGGYDLGRDYAELEQHMLIAVTEMVSEAEIDDLAAALKAVSHD